MNAYVKGGTNAGWKRPRQPAKSDWCCPGCGALRLKWLAKCPDPLCRTKRPD